MAYAMPSPGNVYTKNLAASGQLVVEFARNKDDFPINRYTQQIPVTKDQGLYLAIDPSEATRVLKPDLSHKIWADGQDEPDANVFQVGFQYLPYLTKRYYTGFNIGEKTVAQADWKVEATYAAAAAAQVMADRTTMVVSKYATSANWPAYNTDTATNMGGGKWDVSTTTNLFIQKALRKAISRIWKATGGTVRAKDLHLVISPDLAILMAASPEVHAYLQGSPAALAQLKGDAPNQNGIWGLPETLYGIPLEIEDAVSQTGKKTTSGTIATPDFILGSTVAALMARPGKLVGMSGGRNYSTTQVFVYENMTVESKTDPDARRRKGRIIDDFGVELACPQSGFLFTACSG